jgi:hypothetical protein
MYNKTLESEVTETQEISGRDIINAMWIFVISERTEIKLDGAIKK